jgi:hypothetical protein
MAGNVLGLGLQPHMLVSLTAPKLCARHFEVCLVVLHAILG